jgi:gluconolactonase
MREQGAPSGYTAFSPLADRVFRESAELRKLSTGYRFCEGPVWDPRLNRLYFTDFFNDRIYRWTEGEGALPYREKANWAVGLSMDARGRLVAAEAVSRSVAYTDSEGSVMVAGTYGGRRLNGPNDIVISKTGVWYVTDQYAEGVGGDREIEHNGVYRIRPGVFGPRGYEGGAEILLLDDRVGRPNGIALSPDESILYVNDTDTQEIFAYRLEAGGARRLGVLATLDRNYGPGAPDGMKTDTEGNIWVTGPGGLWVISPGGIPIGILHSPEFVGNFCFGGPENRTLFLTASSSLYAVEAGISGTVPYREDC